MTFRDPVLAGEKLVHTGIRSDNYAAGVSGWRIARDGTVEFNSGTFRGQLTSGTNPGRHVVLNSSTTTDAIDVYDSSNALIFSVNVFGIAKSTNPATAHSSSLQSGNIELDDGAGNNDASLRLLSAVDTVHQSSLDIDCSPPVGITYTLSLLGGSDSGNLVPTLVGNERNKQGSMVQSDQRSTSNLVHTFSGSGTTDGAGHLVIATGATFAATDGHVMYDQTGRSGGIWCAACWYDVSSGSIGTQWMTTAGPLATGTVFYRGKIYG
jgi:hypothetical protein